VGSSNNPISGVTIATILTSSLLLLLLVGKDHATIGAAAAIMIGATVCCAAAISGDNMQDLKAGHIVGATPYKQQIMQIVGVLSAALVMAPVLMLLQHAYGIGEATRVGVKPLEAPQASLMKAVAEGVFQGNLPWGIVSVGAGIAVVIIIIDLLLESAKSSFRTPVLAVAVGIYLPFELSVPILLGGLISVAAKRFTRRFSKEERETADRHGLLFAAGLITGEAMLGILLAIPAVLELDKKIAIGSGTAAWPGIVLLIVVMVALYISSSRRSRAGV
ncbi:MAG TPA: oligopeptide transporter, OPT family, partial [Phycisphaeraceae bacterium]|nr:oligopeptide transporter, OPT family [Phycisphaeraceae bacterium]